MRCHLKPVSTTDRDDRCGASGAEEQLDVQKVYNDVDRHP